MEWRRVWVVKTRSDDAVGKRELIARTPAELRDLLEQARNDPAVWHVRHESRRELAGVAPVECRNGHSYKGGSATAVHPDWTPCECGGHMVWRCRWPGCRDVRVEPPPDYDCTPRIPDH